MSFFSPLTGKIPSDYTKEGIHAVLEGWQYCAGILVGLFMSVEDRIQKVSHAIIACKDEEETVILIQQLQAALREQVAQLRGKLTVPAHHETFGKSEAA